MSISIVIIMQQGSQFQIPPKILKELLNKNEQKRLYAGNDMKIIISKNVDHNRLDQIGKIINTFKEKYIKSFDINRRIAGIQIMSSLVNGFQKSPEAVKMFAGVIVGAILECLGDEEPRVRRQALKTLYYISKTLDEKVIPMFNIIFEKLIGMINDFDQQTRNAAIFFDKSLETILTNAIQNSRNRREVFDLEGFMGIVKVKLKFKNPGVREFLIRWIVSLNEIMSIDLLIYLPDLLQDLLFMLGDKEKDLRSLAQECLKIFQKDMIDRFKEGKLDQYLTEDIINKMVGSLVATSRGKYPHYTNLVALTWLKTLFSFFKDQIDPRKGQKLLFKKIILERFDEILQSILLLMSHENEDVRKASITANDQLMQNITLLQGGRGSKGEGKGEGGGEKVNFGKVMPLLKEMLAEKKSSVTSQAAMKWMKVMLVYYNDKILPQFNDIIEKLVEKFCDPLVKDVSSIIENTAVREEYFQLLIEKMLLSLLRHNPDDLQFQQILRKFSLIQEGDKFCRLVSLQLVRRINDRLFSFAIAHHLAILIISEKPMLPMRRKLQDKTSPDYPDAFMTLFHAFKSNPAALTALCLLARQYHLAYRILLTFAHHFEITQKVMMGFCKLASLLEAPGFLALRLQILERRDPYLLQALTALLMVLPQGKIFNMLKNRLEVAKLVEHEQAVEMGREIIDIEMCLEEFKESQMAFPKS